MNYASLRHVTDAELNAKEAMALWPLHNSALSHALSYAPLPQCGKLIAIEACRQCMCWRGFIDLEDWFAHVAPELAALADWSDLAAGAPEHVAQVQALFEANARPLDMPLSTLFYETVHIRRDLEPPPPSQCLLSLVTPQGRLWLSEYPVTNSMKQRAPGVLSALQTLPLMLLWRLGSSSPSKQLVTQLKHGDVLLICRETFDITSVGKTVGYFSINEGGGVSVRVASMNQIETHESIDEELDISVGQSAESHTAATIADIPLRLDFILQRRMTTIAQLESLYQGQVLQLDPQAERHVEITVNGMRIAMGELVELNGRLGVELQDISIGQCRDETHGV